MLNEKTIINGKEVELDKNEQENVTKFHKSRVAFAVIENDNGYELAMNLNDPREHRVYLKEDFGIDDELFETLIRGYIKPGKINFYVSSSFLQVERKKLTEQLIMDVLKVATDTYGDDDYLIGNGVIVGKPGEEWQPIEIIKKCNVKLKKKRIGEHLSC